MRCCAIIFSVKAFYASIIVLGAFVYCWSIEVHVTSLRVTAENSLIKVSSSLLIARKKKYTNKQLEGVKHYLYNNDLEKISLKKK